MNFLSLHLEIEKLEFKNNNINGKSQVSIKEN